MAAYIRERARTGGTPPSAVFIPLRFAPGEAFQFDFSTETVELGGDAHTVKVAHIRLCYSRKFLVVAYPRETQEMVFDAHWRAFQYFVGVPRRGFCDNMSTAVDRALPGKEREYNRRFEHMTAHYLFEPQACYVAAGWEKGQVERQVALVRQWLFVPRAKFATLALRNAWLAQRCQALAQEQRHPDQPNRTVEVWMNWAICRSVPTAARCCSISSASSMRGLASSLQRTCRSRNVARYLVMRR